MAIRIVDISNGGDFCLWINILKGFYWILRIGLMGEVLKSAKIRLSKSILYVINYWNFFQFFFIEEYQFKSTFFVIDITFLIWCSMFGTSTLNQFSKFNYFLWALMLILWQVFFIILYPPFENSTTRIAINVESQISVIRVCHTSVRCAKVKVQGWRCFPSTLIKKIIAFPNWRGASKKIPICAFWERYFVLLLVYNEPIPDFNSFSKINLEKWSFWCYDTNIKDIFFILNTFRPKN